MGWSDNASNVTLRGTVPRMAPMRSTNYGVSVKNLTVLLKRDRSAHGKEPKLSEIPVVCWDKLAEQVQKNIEVGDYVLVVGRLEEHSYVRTNGTHVIGVEVVAEDVAKCDWLGSDAWRRQSEDDELLEDDADYEDDDEYDYEEEDEDDDEYEDEEEDEEEEEDEYDYEGDGYEEEDDAGYDD